jgi:serine/threonine-protein kinase
MSQEALAVQEVIGGRYLVERLIAHGGMGAVYLGRQLGLDRRVAIKTLIPPLSRNPKAIALFRREAMAIRRLSHPNTVRIYDYGQTESRRFFLVMEYLEGECLDVVLRVRGPLPLPVVHSIGRQVLKSLIEAHAHGVIHRDLKPSNLMLCRQLGESNFVKVFDFGVALTLEDQFGEHRDNGDESESAARPPAKGFAVSGSPRVSRLVGTPAYMSPEQVLGHQVTPRSDLYSLALTLYELAVGAPPYAGDCAEDIARQHIDPSPPDIPETLADHGLAKVLRRALSKHPDDRYQSAAAMLAALDRDIPLEVEPILVGPASPGPDPTGPNVELRTTGAFSTTLVDRPRGRGVAPTPTPEPPAVGPDRRGVRSVDLGRAVDDALDSHHLDLLVAYRLKDRLRRKIVQSIVGLLLFAFALSLALVLV